MKHIFNLLNINDTVFYYLNSTLNTEKYHKAIIKEINIEITKTTTKIIYTATDPSFSLLPGVGDINFEPWEIAKTKEKLIKQLKQNEEEA